MSQFDMPTIDPTANTGTQLSAWLNDWQNALESTHSGPVRPTYAKPGGLWIKQTSPTDWTLYCFDGVHDIALIQFNPTTGVPVGQFLPLAGGTLTGPLNFNGNGLRITGNLGGPTLTDRLLFQSNIANGVTSVGAIPNGTSRNASYIAYNSIDVANASFVTLSINDLVATINSGKSGTGLDLPLIVQVAGAERLRIATTGAATFSGNLAALGFMCRPGNAGAIGANMFNINWAASNADLWIDATKIGALLHSANFNTYSPTLTGGGASGTWGINITGNAAYAATAGSAPANGGNANYANTAGSAPANGGNATNSTNTVNVTGGGYVKSNNYQFDNATQWMVPDASSNPQLRRDMITCSMFPDLANTRTCGSAFIGWNAVYSHQWLAPSDARTKTEKRGLSAAELSAATEIAKTVGAFKYLDKQEGGESIGVIAQEVVEILEALGLDWTQYEFIHHEAREESGEEGADDYLPALDRFSISYPELSIFMAATFETRLAALESQVLH